MKNTMKISLMSGLITAGVLLCGLPHAMAESVPQNDETYYSVNVPSEISLSSDQDETTFTVSGNTYQKRWLDIDITSKNNFNLKNGQVSIPYKLDKTKLEYEPQYVDKDSDSFSENVKLSKNEEDVKYSGDYQDQLQFTMNPVETRTIQLDCNGGTVNGKDTVAYTVKNGSSYGQLPVPVRSGYQFVAWKDDKGNTIYSGSQVEADTEKLSCVWSQFHGFYLHGILDGVGTNYTYGYGTFDIYVNNVKKMNDTDVGYVENLTEGDTIKINDIKPSSGFEYVGLASDEFPFCTYEKDSNGKVVSITFTITPETATQIYFRFNFKSLMPINILLNNNNLTKVIVDSDKPSKSVKSVGTIDIFDSKVDCYADGDALHIYNVKGGKVKAPQNSTKLFASCTAESMDLKGLDVSQVSNANKMFENCTKMTNLDVSNWDTNSLSDMTYIFNACTSLKKLDLNNWNVSKVKDFQSLFFGCRNLIALNISDWNVSNVQSFEKTFDYCSKLPYVDLSNWDTSSARSFYAMFDGCNSINNLDLSKWNTQNVYTVSWMFSGTFKLTNLKGIENWNVQNVKYIEYWFHNCGLSEIKLPDLKKNDINSLKHMFSFANNITEIDLTKIDMNKVTNLKETFAYCQKLKTIYVQNDYAGTSNDSDTFIDCTSLIGGAGTKYDPTFIDSTGARIDGGSSNPGYFTAISQKPIETGSVLNIEGSDYIVLDKKDTDKYLVISKDAICNKAFQSTTRNDGQNQNTYENSEIDNYLETEWYNSLSSKIKNAISITKIKQAAYDNNLMKQETGYNSQTYNTIERHIFLPSVEEIKGLVDLESTSKVKEFLGETSIWTRDSNYDYANDARYLYVGYGGLGTNYVAIVNGIRPSFFIDLSKVDYTVTGTVNYK